LAVLENLIFYLNLLGTMVFALSGALSAGRRRFDLSGVVLVACVVGVGGGTLRDLLLGLTPVFWVREPLWLGVSAATGAALFVIGRRWQPPYRLFLSADALGLGTFTVIGVERALALGLHPAIAVLMGALTGVGGGFLRDVLCGEIPLILQREIYVTAALAGGAALVLLAPAAPVGPWPTLACLLVVVGLRLAAIHWNLNLPVFGGRGWRG